MFFKKKVLKIMGKNNIQQDFGQDNTPFWFISPFINSFINQGHGFSNLRPPLVDVSDDDKLMSDDGIRNRNRVMSRYPYTYDAYQKDANFVKDRESQDNRLRIPFIEDKQVELKDGTIISTNVLDSLARHGAINKVSPEIALGLAHHETKTGKYDSYTFLETKDQYNWHKANYSRGAFVENRGVNPTDLLNNHNYFISPYRSDLNYVMGRKDSKDPWVFGHPETYQKYYNFEPYNFWEIKDNYSKEIEQRMKDTNPNLRKRVANTNVKLNPYQSAFERFKDELYNSKDPNHTKNVELEGSKLMQDPAVKKWWDTEGYRWYENKKRQGGGIYLAPLPENYSLRRFF